MKHRVILKNHCNIIRTIYKLRIQLLMKRNLTQGNLAKVLNTVSRVASSRTTLPVLSNILIRAELNEVSFSATNMELSIIEKTNVKIDEDGTIVVPARLITEFVSNLPKSNITIESKGTQVNITAGNYKSTIYTVSTDEFPALPEPVMTNSFKINASDLKQAINNTVLVASGDTTRPILTGVYFYTIDSKLFLAATDGYRLAEKQVVDCDNKVSAIIPASTLTEVVRILGDNNETVDISFEEDQTSFTIENVTIISRTIEGNFIDYRQLIPKNTDVKIIVDRNEFIRAVKVSELFARESAGSITLSASSEKSTLSIHTITTQIGENNSDMEAEVTGDGTVTLNSKFLLDALNQIDGDNVKMQFSGKLAPVLLTSEKSDSYKHIIMPVKS